jgi:hypothetical protein
VQALYTEIGKTVRYAIERWARTACLIALMVVAAAICALLLSIR